MLVMVLELSTTTEATNRSVVHVRRVISSCASWYIESTYCSRFEREGWISDDGTLSIAAHVVFADGGAEECVTAEAGEEAETVPCVKLEGGNGPLVLDCALLHLVPRGEVREYVGVLERSREVSCDDGTPLDRLGAQP